MNKLKMSSNSKIILIFYLVIPIYITWILLIFIIITISTQNIDILLLLSDHIFITNLNRAKPIIIYQNIFSTCLEMAVNYSAGDKIQQFKMLIILVNFRRKKTKEKSLKN